MAYRQLTSEEIRQLEVQSCSSADWSTITVDQDFEPSPVQQVRFSGSCRIGNLSGTVNNRNGNDLPAGIYQASLHNVTIGDRVLISRVGNLANYTIEEDVIIREINELYVSGESTFGNGTEIEILNEGGGRQLILYDQLNAQIAYLLVMYRHLPEMISSLENMIREYCKTRSGKDGVIGKGSCILNSKTIHNVSVGSFVEINGADFLEEGTIIGDPAERTAVGYGVIARHFMILSGSTVESSALLEKCFLGQGVQIGKQFSAENSAFFANSEGFHGEAVSLFAGPYTVTHHKSTLLIAGYVSFFNAGSGTNQSNHMYKLGPIHQGIIERGSKTGSFSYLLWPSRVGPFSVVMGKHGTNFDASDLPFSYITVENDRTMLTPAMNLITVGTRRDTEKWPKRDRRKGTHKMDLIHFELFNPYVMNKVLNGMEILADLYEKTPKEQEFINYKGLRIKRLMLKSCRKYYEMAWYIFLGDWILKRISNPDVPENLEGIRKRLTPGKVLKGIKWADISGLTAPVEILEEVMEMIAKRTVLTLERLNLKLIEIHQHYEGNVLSWLQLILITRSGIDLTSAGKEELIMILEDWKVNSVRLNNMILSDAKKEFDASSQIGFGL
ncbi:MAG: DUF4954 family protein, partial [Cyclobacteriaceae bacterium]|nr:DUF4954 family protein [Cyclobacteriaceae bacterium]